MLSRRAGLSASCFYVFNDVDLAMSAYSNLQFLNALVVLNCLQNDVEEILRLQYYVHYVSILSIFIFACAYPYNKKLSGRRHTTTWQCVCTGSTLASMGGATIGDRVAISPVCKVWGITEDGQSISST